MSILLTHTYFYTSPGKDKTENTPPLPKELLRMSASLRESKILHEVLDSTFSTFDHLIKTDFSRYKHIVVYTEGSMFSNTQKLISHIRSNNAYKGITLIVWGKDLKSKTETLIGEGADMVILKHPYQSLADLINTLNTPFNPFLDRVPDIAFKNYFGKVFFTETRTEDIDTKYIVPAYDQVDLKKYVSEWNRKKKGIFYPVFIDREVSPTDLAREIELIEKAASPTLYRFIDHEFSADQKWLSSFFSELQKKNTSIRFECCCRATQLNDGIIQQLKSAGCKKLWIITTGNEPVTEEYIVKSKNLGIKTGILIIAGNDIPFEKLVGIVYRSRPDLIAAGEDPAEGSPEMFNTLDKGYYGPASQSETYKAIADYVLYSSKVKFASRWQRRLNPGLWISSAKARSAENRMQQSEPSLAKHT